jgi:hypothetical protein
MQCIQMQIESVIRKDIPIESDFFKLFQQRVTRLASDRDFTGGSAVEEYSFHSA